MPSPNATVSTSVCSRSTGPVAMALVLTESSFVGRQPVRGAVQGGSLVRRAVKAGRGWERGLETMQGERKDLCCTDTSYYGI